MYLIYLLTAYALSHRAALHNPCSLYHGAELFANILSVIAFFFLER